MHLSPPAQRPIHVSNLLIVDVKAYTEKFEVEVVDKPYDEISDYAVKSSKVGPLGVIALINSIIAVAILVFCAVKMMQWDIFLNSSLPGLTIRHQYSIHKLAVQ